MPTFGYETIGILELRACDLITGSMFTCPEDGTADSIGVNLHTHTPQTARWKCAIYLHSDSSLVGVTEERTLTLTSTKTWYIFNFLNPKPSLLANTQYVPVVWEEYFVKGTNDDWVAYDTGDTNQGHEDSEEYDSFPNPASFGHNSNKLSIYCTYTPAVLLVWGGSALPQLEMAKAILGL